MQMILCQFIIQKIIIVHLQIAMPSSTLANCGRYASMGRLVRRLRGGKRWNRPVDIERDRQQAIHIRLVVAKIPFIGKA